MKKNSLVIVESPTKARTISKFLDTEFTIYPSGGHLFDLPRSSMGVDIKNNFQPTYIIIKEKKKIVSQLKKEITNKSDVYIASDPDREGEAIGWHIAEHLAQKKKIHRVIFHEITKEAIKKAFQHPTKIDLKKVNAQQARRILDRIVGYSISPILWKRVGRGLSAGRVQSVAVRLIVERERQILSFIPREYWQIEAELSKAGLTEKFIALLDKVDDKKADIKDEKEAHAFIKELEKEHFIVKDIKDVQRKRNPVASFTTSKLQQAAFNKLRFPAEKTMRIAQQLYEGIELGKEGSIGLITYMRTDSVKVSQEAIKDVRKYIEKEFGKEFLPEKANIYKSKKGAQEAHEAIRPTSVFRKPELIKDYLTQEQYKLYKLIWDKFVSSQMKPAVYLVTNVDIAAGSKFIFRASGTQVLFKGFTVIYEEDGESNNKLPQLQIGEKLDLISLVPTQHFTQPPPRFSDASLIKALEENGIGRPSTYAPIIQTIIIRGYVSRREGYLYPTELGIIVTDLLMKHFPKVMDVEFTAFMEDELDQIEEGKLNWIEVLKTFYGPFSKDITEAHANMENIKKQVIETDEKCPECGKVIIVKIGRTGRFLACSGFPECKFTKSITTDVPCPNEGCSGKLVQRRSKKGALFYGCSNYPKCNFVARRLPRYPSEEEKKETKE